MFNLRFNPFILSTVTFLMVEPVHGEIRFARDIQPILSDHCYTCHGPDANQRKADFRLDVREEAMRDLDGYFAIVPEHPEQSELIARIESDDPDDIMPPPDANLSLSSEEVRLLKQWIAEGAEWEQHWAFVPPTRPALPSTSHREWERNQIDRFVSKELESHEELNPSPEASPATLLRRLSIDLTGLPPSIDELDKFLADPRPDRYERAVDRLLSSDAYAERMALEWMDVARYADSHGMHADGWRMMWPWRDWVIDSFKQNQAYDEFVTWQLAGDLLPNPTDDQIIATAFHRNHAMTAEGGIVDEEFRIQYVFDRAQTTATAFLGLTLECARCHDHKFDPLSQTDYYQLTAFFNNLKELGMTGDDGNYGPMHLLKTPQQKERLSRLETEIESKEQELTTVLKASQPSDSSVTVTVPAPTFSYPFDSIELVGEEKKAKRIDGNEKTGLSGSPELASGKIGKALRFDSEYDIVSLQKAGLFDTTDRFTVSLWAKPEAKDKPQSLIGNAGAKNNFWRGWDFHLDAENRLAIKLIHSLPHSYIHVRSIAPVRIDEWTQLSFTYDGSSRADGVSLFIDGEKVPTVTEFDQLHKTIYPVSGNAKRDREDRALRIGKAYRSFTGEYGIFTGSIDEVRLWNDELTAAELTSLYQTDLKQPSQIDPSLLSEHAVKRQPGQFSKLRKQLTSLYKERQEIVDGIPELMVMEEISPPRKTFVLRRGQYDAPTEEVTPGTPEAVLPFPDDYPKNRLGLAKWLFDENNPLTARVAVNRYWQLFFGKGLVVTTEDFGIQGSRPSHPELLDWLAVEFRDSGWNLRHLHRLIVSSATYRQSSRTSKAAQQIDPQNTFLSRGPQHRLPAELIRDQALAASGLLVPVVGGPSVKPFQPEGLWIDKGNFSAKLLRYKPDSGEKLYRRSLYTFIRRTSPHPAMVAFDASNRDVCQVRRESTNTPLQALVLMNDPQFVEAARIMAERIQREAGSDLSDQIRHAFRLVTSRRATQEEVEVIQELHNAEFKRLQANPKDAEALLKTGDHPLDSSLDPTHTAALTVVANTLLNHDEFYTKR